MINLYFLILPLHKDDNGLIVTPFKYIYQAGYASKTKHAEKVQEGNYDAENTTGCAHEWFTTKNALILKDSAKVKSNDYA